MDGPLLSPICLFAISGKSAIVLHAHFWKLGPGEWPQLPEQDTPPLSASHSCTTSIESLIDRILTVPEILPPDECPKDLEISETVIERWVQQLADPNLDCAELDSQYESSPSSDEGSVGTDVPPDGFMGRYGWLGNEEGLETVETLQVLAKQVETSSSISSSNLLGPGFDSQDSGKCMELRPRENPKDSKERCQRYWGKVAALTGTSRPPTKRTSIHPQVYKEGRFSLDPQWSHRILHWAGDEFQPQRYPSADPRSTTKVKRPGKRAGVWVNTPKGGAAVTQGLNKPWHDDTIFDLCPHKYLQQVAEKAIWEGSRGIMIVPRHKTKKGFRGLGEVTVGRWDLPHDALCFRDEGGTPRSPGKLGARVIIFDAFGGDQEGLGQTDFKKSHVDPPPQEHLSRPGHRSTAWSQNFREASTKTKSHTPHCVTFPRRPVGMSRKAWKVQRVPAAARRSIPLPPDSILNSILPRLAVMSQESYSILNSTLPCSTVMSVENDSMTELRAQEQEPSLDQLVERVCIEQNCVNPPPSLDLPEVCEPRITKVSFVHRRSNKVSLQDRISDPSKGLQNASPSGLTSEDSQTLSLKANDHPWLFQVFQVIQLPFSGQGIGVRIL